MNDYVIFWRNDATKSRSFLVRDGGSHHWEPEKNGGLELATGFASKSEAASFRRSLGHSMRRQAKIERRGGV